MTFRGYGKVWNRANNKILCAFSPKMAKGEDGIERPEVNSDGTLVKGVYKTENAREIELLISMGFEYSPNEYDYYKKLKSLEPEPPKPKPKAKEVKDGDKAK